MKPCAKQILMHVVTALVCIELIARLASNLIGVYVHQPFIVSQRIGPVGSTNAHKPLTWITNERGARGELYHGQPFRIAVFGTSTTAGIFLDQSEAWPEQLRRQLGADQIHVDNFAVDGGNVPEAVAMMKKLANAKVRYDLLIAKMQPGEKMTPEFLYTSDWQTNRLSYAVSLLPKMLIRQIRREPRLKSAIAWIRNRLSEQPELHPLSFANREKRVKGEVELVYAPCEIDNTWVRQRTTQLLTSAKPLARRTILVTQPVAFSEGALPEVAERWISLHPIAGQENAFRDNRSIAEKIRGEQAIMTQVAHSMGVEVVDLDAAIRPQLSESDALFDDKWHPAPPGAALIGKIVADHIQPANNLVPADQPPRLP